MKLRSLRSRLIVIILTPLLVISSIAGLWQFWNATERAEAIFDRGLLSAALAISRDVAVSDGDALSPATRRLVNNTSGGELFYHVYAPDGVFVTGYSTPPVLPRSTLAPITEPIFYNARYQGRDVRVLRFQDVTTASGISGVFTITVWQNASVRTGFVREVVSRSFAVIALLVLSVAFVVWFGVGLGLRPLLDLESAIAKRTPTELEPIRRQVPSEAKGLVKTLNLLLDRVSRRISSKDEFISNAAHQLRNPVAGILALSEAVENARTLESARKRSAELSAAAREASHLTNQLLSFERAGGTDIKTSSEQIDVARIVTRVADRFAQQQSLNTSELSFELPEEPLFVHGDPVMLQEALLNLVTNATVHGGPDVSQITIKLSKEANSAVLTVKDDGIGIPPEKRQHAMSRFMQTNDGPGSGLGLPIAARVASNHGGTLKIQQAEAGTEISMSLPLSGSDRSLKNDRRSQAANRPSSIR